MDSSLLKVFVAVAQQKSISLGATQLGFTQANVTLRIKQLEKDLAFSLFHRTPKGVVLTKEGERLYPNAVEIVKKIDELSFKIRNVSAQTNLKIGTSQVNAMLRLLPFIEKLKKDFPELEIELYVNSTPNIIEKLLDYKLDIAFISGNPSDKNIEIIRSFDDDLYIIESKDVKSQNTLFAYREQSINYDYFAKYYRENENDDFKKMVIESYALMLACVKSGMGKALIAKKVVDMFGYTNLVNFTKVDELNNKIKTELICRKDNAPVIIDYLKKMKLK
ncbi:MAG: LysR family transcriptional regulator [Campylobacteraceae bacterium]